jgi:PAS domain S-box-containing protein
MHTLSDGSVFRLAVEASPAGVIVCDEAGTILFVNSQVGETFGYTSQELVGQPIDILIPRSARSAYQEFRQRLLNEPDSRLTGTRDLAGMCKDGSPVPVEVGLTVVNGGNRHLVVTSLVDNRTRFTLLDRIAEKAKSYASFERLLTDLAGQFVQLPPEEVDEAIVDGLRQVCESLDLDRSSWWYVTDSSDDPRVTHTWTREEYRIMEHGESAAQLVPGLVARLRKGDVVPFSNPSELSNSTDRVTMQRFNTKSGIALPFSVNGELRGILGFTAIRRHRDWPEELIDRLRFVTVVFGQVLMRKESEELLRATMAEVTQLREQLTAANVQLRRDVRGRGVQGLLVAESPITRKVLEQIDSVAPTNATVLLLGETGVGKEVFAQAIHRASDRHARPMVVVNCGAIPSALIESELFGRERGAYTGALAKQIGRFEMAQDSTIFLDEIGELPLEAQVKLLRVIQDKVIERLGGGQPIKVNVRIIAATNRDLEKAVEDRTFREDLFYRLNVFPITIPALRDRREDIAALVWSFIEEYSASFRKPIDSISKESLAALQAYSWPGNVRELRNMIERAVIVSRSSRLIVDVPTAAAGTSRKTTRLADLEAEQIHRVLESVGWRVRGKGGAAELLGIKPNTLDSRMAKLGIRRPGSPA